MVSLQLWKILFCPSMFHVAIPFYSDIIRFSFLLRSFHLTPNLQRSKSRLEKVTYSTSNTSKLHSEMISRSMRKDVPLHTSSIVLLSMSVSLIHPFLADQVPNRSSLQNSDKTKRRKWDLRSNRFPWEADLVWAARQHDGSPKYFHLLWSVKLHSCLRRMLPVLWGWARSENHPPKDIEEGHSIIRILLHFSTFLH